MVCRIAPAVLDVLCWEVALVPVRLVDASVVTIFVLAAYRYQRLVAEVDVVAGVDSSAVEAPGVGLPLPAVSKVLIGEVGSRVVATATVLIAGVGGLGGADEGGEKERKSGDEHLFINGQTAANSPECFGALTLGGGASRRDWICCFCGLVALVFLEGVGG